MALIPVATLILWYILNWFLVIQQASTGEVFLKYVLPICHNNFTMIKNGIFSIKRRKDSQLPFPNACLHRGGILYVYTEFFSIYVCAGNNSVASNTNGIGPRFTSTKQWKKLPVIIYIIRCEGKAGYTRSLTFGVIIYLSKAQT